MIRPAIGELLEGVATGLEEGVLPGLEPATRPRNQLRAALAILRRVAAVWDQVVPAVDTDNRDIEHTLREVVTGLGGAAPLPANLGRRLDEARPATEGLPDFERVCNRNADLQRLLVEVQDALATAAPGGAATRAAAELGALLERITARERALARR